MTIPPVSCEAQAGRGSTTIPTKPPSKVLTGVKLNRTSSVGKAKPTPVPLDEGFMPTPSGDCAAVEMSATDIPSPVASGSLDLVFVETEVIQDILLVNRNREVHGVISLRRFVDTALERYESESTMSTLNSSYAPSHEYLAAAAMPRRRYSSGTTVPTPPNPKRFSKGINPRRLFASETCLDDFIVRAKLGSGAYGIVYRVEDKVTNQTMALKVIKKRGVAYDDIQQFRVELDAMKRLMGDHYCIQIEAGFQDKECLYLALAFCPGGDLHGLISNYRCRSLPVEHARFYAAELLVGVHHLHRQGIIHRDLKPSNILIDSRGHLVIADLGMAKVFPLEDPDTFSPYNPTGSFACLSQEPYLSGTFCGTIEYMAPEILLGLGYGFAVDFWAVGIILYEMLVGRPPWIRDEDDDSDCINRAITMSKPYFMYDFHPHAQNLLKNMLRKNVSQRLLYEEMLHHPFFASIDWKRVEKRTLPPFRIPVIQEYDPSSTHPISFDHSRPASDPLPNFNFISPTLKRERRRVKSSWKIKAKKNIKGLRKVVAKIFSHRDTPEGEKHPTLVDNDETRANRASEAARLEQPSSHLTPNDVEDTPLLPPPAISLEATLVGSSSGSSGFKRWVNRILHPIPVAHVLVGKNRKPIDLTA